MLFADHVIPRLVKWRQINGGLQFGSEDLIASYVIWLPLSLHACLGLDVASYIVEYWPFVGTSTRHSYSKLYYCVILQLLLCLSLIQFSKLYFFKCVHGCRQVRIRRGFAQTVTYHITVNQLCWRPIILFMVIISIRTVL